MTWGTILSHTVTTRHMWLFTFKLITIKYILTFSFSLELVAFQVFNRPMLLVAIMLASTALRDFYLLATVYFSIFPSSQRVPLVSAALE